MTALERLKALLRNERGNTLLIGAAALPMLMASAGFAVDTIQFGVMKRQMQRAADSSAIAGAYALTQEMAAEAAVTRDLTKNKYPTLSQGHQVTVGPSLGFQRTVRVELTAAPRLPFMSIFTKAPSTVTGVATAAVVDEGRFCVLSLYNGTNAGIDVGGDAELNLGCGMASNARGAAAVIANGNSMVNASPIMAVGGLTGTGNNYAAGTKLQPYSAEQKDPFAYLADPPPQTCTESITVQPTETKTIAPGCYKSIDIKGTATFSPGTFYVNGGDVSFGAQAKVTGVDVSIVMTGPGGQAGDLTWNGGADVTLTAPRTGEYAGILFYRDRRASNIEIKINGSASSALVGGLYFPSSDVTLTGDAGMQSRCLQMVGQLLKFRGTATIDNNCPLFSNLPSFRLQFVRLVQ